jgi:hypothetical protein
VKTDLMSKEPDHIDAPIGELMGEIIRSGVQTGVPAAGIADDVVGAVDAGDFWILTHDEMRQAPVERMQRAASGTNPDLAALMSDEN